ncbi:hypothetical protein Tco_1165005 [Tanacetum coccineum]
MILHVFVKDDVVVDGTQRNVAPPPCVIAKKGLVIREPEAGPQRSIIQDSPEAKEMFKLMEYEIESRNDVVRAREIVEKNLDALESNVRRIQVNDIVKEVEDYLKTYSSAGMDNSWYVEGIR